MDGALLAAALSCVTASRCCSLSPEEWPRWNWVAVAELLDGHLLQPTVLALVETRTRIMARIGTAFSLSFASKPQPPPGAKGSRDLALMQPQPCGVLSLPWVPASLRFVLALRQWFLLCLHHPSDAVISIALSREGGGPVVDLFLAIFAQMCPTFSTAAGRAAASVGGSRLDYSGAPADFHSSTLSGPELAAFLCVRPLLEVRLVNFASWDALSSSLSRNNLSVSLVRELVSVVVGAVQSTERGWALLSAHAHLGAATSAMLNLPDAPVSAEALASLLRDLGVDGVDPLRDADIAAVAREPLLALIGLGSDTRPDLFGLARLVLLSLSFGGLGTDLKHCDNQSTTRGCDMPSSQAQALLLLRAWTTRVRDTNPSPSPSKNVFFGGEALALFATSHLRSLFRRGEAGFCDWGVLLLCDIVSAWTAEDDLRVADIRSSRKAFVRTPRSVAEAALSILTEAAESHRVLRLSILLRQPRLGGFTLARVAPLATALMMEGGVALRFLNSTLNARNAKAGKSVDLLGPRLLRRWLGSGHLRWARAAESSLTAALSSTALGSLSADGHCNQDYLASALLPFLSGDQGRLSEAQSPRQIAGGNYKGIALARFDHNRAVHAHARAQMQGINSAQAEATEIEDPASASSESGAESDSEDEGASGGEGEGGREEEGAEDRIEPLPLPLRVLLPGALPPADRDAARVGASAASAAATAAAEDAVVGADLASLTRLPWRIVLWVEWRAKVSVPHTTSDADAVAASSAPVSRPRPKQQQSELRQQRKERQQRRATSRSGDSEDDAPEEDATANEGESGLDEIAEGGDDEDPYEDRDSKRGVEAGGDEDEATFEDENKKSKAKRTKRERSRNNKQKDDENEDAGQFEEADGDDGATKQRSRKRKEKGKPAAAADESTREHVRRPRSKAAATALRGAELGGALPSVKVLRRRIRFEVPLDTVLDLSPLRPERDGLDSRLACDGFVRGSVCFGNLVNGVLAEERSAAGHGAASLSSLPLPPDAVMRAALFCGAHAVSQIGDIPFSAFPKSESAAKGDECERTNRRDVTLAFGDRYSDAATLVSALAASAAGRNSSIPPAEDSTAAAEPSAVQTSGITVAVGEATMGSGARARSLSFGVASTSPATKPSAASASSEMRPDWQRGRSASDAADSFARSALSGATRVVDRSAQRIVSPSSLARSAVKWAGEFAAQQIRRAADLPATLTQRLLRSAAGVADAHSPHILRSATGSGASADAAGLDGAGAKIRSRNASAVEHILPPQRGSDGQVSPHQQLLQQGWQCSWTKDVGLDASRSPSVPSPNPVALAAQDLKDFARSRALWATCSAAEAFAAAAAADAPALQNKGAVSLHTSSREISVCPPGQCVRFVFSASPSPVPPRASETAQPLSAHTADFNGVFGAASEDAAASAKSASTLSLSLVRVEFGVALIPRLSAARPLTMHMHAAMAASRAGARELRRGGGGHIRALLETAFGQGACSSINGLFAHDIDMGDDQARKTVLKEPGKYSRNIAEDILPQEERRGTVVDYEHDENDVEIATNDDENDKNKENGEEENEDEDEDEDEDENEDEDEDNDEINGEVEMDEGGEEYDAGKHATNIFMDPINAPHGDDGRGQRFAAKVLPADSPRLAALLHSLDPHTAPALQRRAALWSLAHIGGSSRFGVAAILRTCPDFFLRYDAAARGLRLVLVRGDAGGDCAALSDDKCDVHSAPTYFAVPDAGDDVSVRVAAAAALPLLARQAAGRVALSALGWALFARKGRSAGPGRHAVPATAPVTLPREPATAFTLLTRQSAALGASILQHDWPRHARVDDSVFGLSRDGGHGEGAEECAGYAPVPFLHPSRLPPMSALAALAAPASSAVSASAAALAALAPSSVEPRGTGSTKQHAKLATTAPHEALLSAVRELGSRITQREARSALLKLKAEQPALFASSATYAHVCALLARHALSLPARRLLTAVFDRVSFYEKTWASAPS